MVVFATFPAKGNVINIPAGVPISPNASWDLSRFSPDCTSGIRASQTPKTTGWIKKIPITWEIGFQEIDLIIWIIL